MAILVLRAAKVVFFLVITIVIGRALGNSYLWVNHSFAYKIVNLFYGGSEAGAENIEDIFFYIGFITVILISTIIYLLTMKLIKKIRS